MSQKRLSLFLSLLDLEGKPPDYGSVAQKSSALPCHGKGRGFKSHQSRHSRIEKWSSHHPHKLETVGSNPTPAPRRCINISKRIVNRDPISEIEV